MKSLCFGKGIAELCKRILLLLQSTVQTIEKNMDPMAALQTFPDKVQCVQSGLLILRDELIRDSSDQWSGWYRFGHFNLDTWNYVAYTAVLRRHLCHLIFAKECTNPEYHGVLIISSKTTVPMPVSNEPPGPRSYQSQAEDLEILERFNHVPPNAETYWHMLEHPSLVEKLPLEHRYFQRAEDSCESHTSQEVEQGQCDQGSKVLPQAPQYENQMTMHLSRLSWPNFDCKTAFVLTWFLSTISVSGLAGWMPVVQRWQAAGTSQAQVVATSG